MQNSGISSLATISASRSPAGSTHSRVALSGRSIAIDPRIEAVRRDLADVRLAGRIFAPHYAAAQQCMALRAAPIRRDRGHDADVISEILPGERFETLEIAKEFAWGVCAIDGAVGYVPADALGESVAPDHVVTAVTAEVRAQAAADAPVVAALPMGARVASTGSGAFREIAGGFVAADALRGLADPLPDHATVAERLIGVPHVPGGRSGAGVDATGLIFLALAMAGYVAPRFCDLQASRLGKQLDADQPTKRGDLVFFEDHAAILLDADSAVHVAPQGVVREPLDQLVTSGRWGSVIARRRVA